MKREDYISDEMVVKRVNEAVRIELEKRKRWIYRSLLIGLERRKLRLLKWEENFDWDNDRGIKDKLKIANAVSDMCMPQIVPDVTFQTIEGKCIVQIEIYPGQNRPYYIRSMGKENGTYIRVAGISRPVDEAILKDLEYQGTGKSYDEIINVETDYDEKLALNLCNDIRTHIAESSELPINKVREITVTNLENWGILVREGATKKGRWSIDLEKVFR